MFRVSQNARVLNKTVETINTVFPNIQTVRWRKPRWVPVAKSKRFRVPQRPQIPEDERVELQRLFNAYRTQMKSLRAYLINRYSMHNQVSEDPEEQKRIFDEDFARCMKINDEWNVQIRSIREKHMEQQLKADLNFAEKRIELELLKQEKKSELVEELVREEIAKSGSYITAENIDSAIDTALQNEVDHNFAIDVNGEKIWGRDTVPKPVDPPLQKEKIIVKQ